MTRHLDVRLFGRFQVARDGLSIAPEAWRGKKTRDLLKILLLARGRHVPKDRLLDHLWTTGRPEDPDSNLHSVVSNLRRALEPDLPSGRESAYILTLPEGYAFDMQMPLSVDLFEYEKTLTAESTVGLDTLLPKVPETLLEENPYDEWAESERERLRGMRLQALARLAHAGFAERDFAHAIQACEAALAADPSHETLWRVLMQAYAASGDRAAALHAYDRCRISLARDLGVDPMPETTRLHQSILQDEPEPSELAPPPSFQEAVQAHSAPSWLLKLGALGGLAWVGLTLLGLVVSFASLQTGGFIPASDPGSDVLPLLAAQPEALRTTLRSWPVLVPAGLLLLPTYLAWFNCLAPRGALAWIGVSFGVIDALGQTLSRMLVLGRLTILPGAYLAASTDQQLFIETLWDVLRQLSSGFGVASVISHPVAVGALSLAAWRLPAFPAWLTRSGLGLAALNLVYTILLPPSALGPLGFGVGLAVAFASYAWVLGLAWTLWRRSA